MIDFSVALLQMRACINDQQASLEKGERFCRQAATMHADLALFPEMWNTGYTPGQAEAGYGDVWRAAQFWEPGQDQAALVQLESVWQGQALALDGEYVAHFRKLAVELNMSILLTLLEAHQPLPRNSAVLIDRHGEILYTYAKVHTCEFDIREASLTPGDAFHTARLDLAEGDALVGTMICYDREFPESARLLMLQGAEIILVPNACQMEQNRMAQLRTRAFENMTGLALANYAGPSLGHSAAFDAVAFDKDGSRDTLLVDAGAAEGVYLARFDLDRIREYRRREAWGASFRKPHRYSALASSEVPAPFCRVNSQGQAFDPTRR